MTQTCQNEADSQGPGVPPGPGPQPRPGAAAGDAAPAAGHQGQEAHHARGEKQEDNSTL